MVRQVGGGAVVRAMVVGCRAGVRAAAAVRRRRRRAAMLKAAPVP